MHAGTVSIDERLDYYLTCAIGHEPLEDGDIADLTPADEVRIFDNSANRVPTALRFQERPSLVYTDYLEVRLGAFACGEKLTAAELLSIIDPNQIAGAPSRTHLADLAALLIKQRQDEEQALAKRLAQLPRDVVVAQWYYKCDALDRWIANVQAAEAQRHREARRPHAEMSYETALGVAREDLGDADTQRVLEECHAGFDALASAIQEHLRGAGAPKLEAALGRVAERPVPSLPDIGDEPEVGGLLLNVALKMAASEHWFVDRDGLLADFAAAVVHAAGCDWADFLVADASASLTPVATSGGEPLGPGYLRAQGITGSAVLLPEDVSRRWVGTNRLQDDPRQSRAHTAAYSMGSSYPSDFWVFPVFHEGALFGAFRVVKRSPSRCAAGVPWSDYILGELRDIALWFEATVIPRLTYKPNVARSPAEAAHTPAARAFEAGCGLDWVGEGQLVRLLAHATSVVHRRVERNSLGCCIGVFPGSLAGPVLESLGGYFPVGPIGFDDAPVEDHLEMAARFYESVDPSLGMFVFDTDGRGHGVALVDAPGHGSSWHGELSGRNQALILLLERGQDCIRLYTKGHAVADYYLSDAAGVWVERSYPAIEGAILRAAAGKVSGTIVCEVLARAFEMSHQRLGAMLIIGGEINRDLLNKHRRFSTSVLLSGVSEKMFADVARVDGAVHITPDGTIACNGAIIRTGATGSGEGANRGGGRHAAAETFSRESPDHIVIVVSENRSVSVLAGGEYIVERR